MLPWNFSMWTDGWRLSADVPTQPGKQPRKVSAFTRRPGLMACLRTLRRGREGLWGMDSSIRNGGEEEMAKSQGHVMTMFNLGGFVWAFLLLFHVFDLCFSFCLFVYSIVYVEPIILRPE